MKKILLLMLFVLAAQTRIQAQCGSATAIAGTGTYTAPGPETWYSFVPTSTGIYTITTCSLGNTCNNKLYVYDYCTGLVPDTNNLATIYYADNNCGFVDATINAYLVTAHTYYIRIGQSGSSCTGTPIFWDISEPAVIVGCLDTTACNFNPFTTVVDNSTCVYYPSPLCPTGSDLVVDSTMMSTSLYVDSNNNGTACYVQEGCMNGYGKRELINFSTKISNIGATDFYAGTPPAATTDYSSIFEWNTCHGHWHFRNYADYLLADSNNNFIPIGYKNGFCVLDLTCSTGSYKFGCSNMGITAGCADIYSSGLPCQWLDITDIPNGKYKVIVRVNAIPRPDFYGRYETNYVNNWTRVCIDLHNVAGGGRDVTILTDCDPYYDCNGVLNGLSVPDCDGNCNGTRLQGDVNVDSFRNPLDVTWYLVGAINHTLLPTKCNDLNADGDIDVVDAALLTDCNQHGPGPIPTGHTHEPCKFPNLIKNLLDTVEYTIGTIDYTYHTVDIYMKNNNAKILGYQLKVEGLTILSVENLITPFAPSAYAKPSGEIIALSQNEVPIPVQAVAQPVLRITYSSIDSNHVCISNVVATVNSAYEEVYSTRGVPACITAIPTGIDPIVDHNAPHYLYPNPFSTSTTLVLNNPVSRTYNAVVRDMTGRIVSEYNNQKNQILVIDRAGLAAGMYMLEVNGDGWQIQDKLQIQ